MLCCCNMALWCLAEQLCRRERWWSAPHGDRCHRSDRPRSQSRSAAVRAAVCDRSASARCAVGRCHRRHFWLRSLMELARASSRSEDPPALQCLREARRGEACCMRRRCMPHAAAVRAACGGGACCMRRRCAGRCMLRASMPCAGAPVGTVRAAAARRGSDWRGRALRVPAAGIYRFIQICLYACLVYIFGRSVGRPPPGLRRQPSRAAPRTHAAVTDRRSGVRSPSRRPRAAPARLLAL